MIESVLKSRAAAVKLVKTSDNNFDKIRLFGLRDTFLLDNKTLQKQPRMKIFGIGCALISKYTFAFSQ